MKSISKHLPWTKNSCRKIVSYPSQVISAYVDNKVIHITIDSGATVSFIIESEAKRLGMKIEKASQLARQADGDTMMHVLGEVHGVATRGDVTFEVHALVVPKLDDAQFLAGMNFMMENKVSQEPYMHRILVDRKYSIEETPSKFIYPSDIPQSKTTKIKQITVVPKNESFKVQLPSEYLKSSKFVVDASDQANSNQDWLFQEVEAVNQTLTILNDSGKDVILGKTGDTSVIKIRPVVDINQDDKTHVNKSENYNYREFKRQEDTKTYVSRLNSKFHDQNPLPKDAFIPEKSDPEEYLKDIYIEPGVMNEKQSIKLKDILRKYHRVFDGDISEGYNNASGEFDVDWNWLNDQKPPPGVSRQEVYSNEEMNRIKQD